MNALENLYQSSNKAAHTCYGGIVEIETGGL